MQRPLAPAIAAHVDRDRSKAGPRDHRELVPPRVPEPWKPVTKQDRRPLALGDRVHPNPVGFDLQVLGVAHDLRVPLDYGFAAAATASTRLFENIRPVRLSRTFLSAASHSALASPASTGLDALLQNDAVGLLVVPTNDLVEQLVRAGRRAVETSLEARAGARRTCPAASSCRRR